MLINTSLICITETLTRWLTGRGWSRLNPYVELGLSLARGVFVVVEFSAAFIAFVLRHIVEPEPP